MSDVHRHGGAARPSGIFVYQKYGTVGAEIKWVAMPEAMANCKYRRLWVSMDNESHLTPERQPL